jgi:DNA-binding transcriptional ArsR family regulator
MEAIQPSLAEVAALVGNPARANMLTALLDGRALTATELAFAGGVAPQTASGHLAKLTEGRLLTLAKQGRHAYYRLASPMIGRMLESIMAVAADGPPATSRDGAAATRCAMRAPATTTWQGGWVWVWPMRSPSATTSRSRRMAAS